jgi:uncharacterized membrane protein YedE/YeeE
MEATYVYGLVGGCLIGLGSLLGLMASGKIPGISGVFGRLLRPQPGDSLWRVIFLIGLILGAAVTFGWSEHAAIFRIPAGRNLIVFAIAGVLVGIGTRIGGGCTSGHGVCGMGMGARDSIVATGIFMATGFVTVGVFRMIAGS